MCGCKHHDFEEGASAHSVLKKLVDRGDFILPGRSTLPQGAESRLTIGDPAHPLMTERFKLPSLVQRMDQRHKWSLLQAEILFQRLRMDHGRARTSICHGPGRIGPSCVVVRVLPGIAGDFACQEESFSEASADLGCH